MGLTPAEWAAVALSVRVGLAAVAITLPLGIAVGWLLARRTFPGKWLVEVIVNLTLVLPPVVTGYLLLRMLGSQSWLGGWLEQTFGTRIAFTWWAAAIASAALGFPLMVRAIRIAFQGVDPRLEQAARTLGAGPLDAFLTVSLPLARGGIIAGAVLAFARSIGEFGATITFAGNIPGLTQTLPLAVFSEMNRAGGDGGFRLAVVAVLLAAAALAASEWLERRGTRP
ncbi:MAG TPA: molybdate ABC transporter permease subunit [Acidobacteriota bacterium]